MIDTITDYVCGEDLDYNFDDHYDEIRTQIDLLGTEFEESDEAEGLPSASSTATFFCDMFLNYEGITLADCSMRQIKETVEHTIPRKMTMRDSTEAEEFIEELIQFWVFLGRQYKHPHSARTVTYLESIRTEFVKWMFDESKAGMTKSLFLDNPEGLNFESVEDVRAFIENHNAQMNANQSKFVDFPVTRTTPKVGRNEPCPCGSGKKYKKCCGSN